MILTDREWLRFVTFGLVAGAALGALYTGAAFLQGHSPAIAISAGVIGPGILAVIVHVAVRKLLDRATAPPADELEDEPPADQPATDTDTDS